MKGRIEVINISQIVNYFENPRHAIGGNEKDTLKKLFDAVGVQYMLNLAADVYENGFLGCQQITLVYSEVLEKYVVYEGNRRVACMKLLKNPEYFDFLDTVTRTKVKAITSEKSKYDLENLDCYITDEEEAFFIMERVHSGEDKGRGTKQWTSREKDSFKVRQNHTKSLQYLIDFYSKKFFDGFDITTVLPFTTIQRIFTNREIKKEIGLDSNDESSFTKERMDLVMATATWVKEEAEKRGEAPTRLFNKAREIEDVVLPWILAYKEGAVSTENPSRKDGEDSATTNPTDNDNKDGKSKKGHTDKGDSGGGIDDGNPGNQDKKKGGSEERSVKILLLKNVSIEEGTELYLKRDDIISVPADRVQIIKCTQMEIRDGDIFKDNNVPGQYVIEYLYESKRERLNLTVNRKNTQRLKENGLFKASNQYIGDIDLGSINEIVHQLYELNYQKHYLLYIISFRAIIENMAKEYIIQNGLSLSGQFKQNVANMATHLLNRITITSNDPQNQQKNEIHTLFKGFTSLKNFLNSVEVKFTSGNYDSLLHSMTHNPSIVSYSLAIEIANEMIVPLHMLIHLIDEKM